MSATPCFVGIDVAKAQLEITLRPARERGAVANDDMGIAALVAKATGQLAKTDPLDAQALAYVAEAVRLPPGPCLTPKPPNAAPS